MEGIKAVCFSGKKLFYHNKKHFETLLTINGMGMTCGHNNGFALVQLIRLAV